MMQPNKSYTFTKINNVIVPTWLLEVQPHSTIFKVVNILMAALAGIVVLLIGMKVSNSNPASYILACAVGYFMLLLMKTQDQGIEISRVDGSIRIYSDFSRKKFKAMLLPGEYEFTLLKLYRGRSSSDWHYIVQSAAKKGFKKKYKIISFYDESDINEIRKYAVRLTAAIHAFINNLPYDRELIVEAPNVRRRLNE